MPHISALPPEIASKEARAVYEEFSQRMSFPAPPNFIKTQGHSAVVARGTWGLVENVLVNGEIPRWEKELIFVAISSERGCRYCIAAHMACCRTLGIEGSLIDLVVRDAMSLPDSALRAKIIFSLKCARDPQNMDTDDFDKLRKYGINQAQILELVAMAGLAVYANILADVAAMEPDEIFEAP